MDAQMLESPSVENHLAAIEEALKKSCFDQAKEYFTSSGITKCSAENALATTRALVPYIDPAQEAKNPGLGVTCRWMLLKLVETLDSPDEVYLELLCHMDAVHNDFLLLTMLKCAEVCIGKMTDSRPRGLTWLLMTLKDTFAEIRAKANEEVENVPYEEIEDRLLTLYTGLEEFYLPYISHLDAPDNHTSTAEQKQQLSVFFLNQLVYTELPKPFIANFVGSLAKVLPHVGYPLVYLADRSPWKKHKTDTYHYLDEVVHNNSFEMLYYYVFHEGVSYDQFPQIFSPQFLFVHVGALSAQLLVHPEHYSEGLNLLVNILNKVDPGSISHWALSSNHHYHLLSGLTKGMVFNSQLEVRKDSSLALKKLFYSFDEKGRFLILYHSFRWVQDQGVRGYLVTFVKDFVMQYLNSGGYFMKNLPELLSFIFVLPKKEKTLIHECNDTVISLLNLLRYLIVVDPKPGNQTGLWRIKTAISERFMTPMASALSHSRQYLVERKNDAEILPKSENKWSESKVITIENEDVPVPNYKQELEGISLMCTHLDLVKFVYEMVKEEFPQ